MGSRIQVFSLVIFTQILVIAAQTNESDLSALSALKSSWQNLPDNWTGDPCSGSWEGVTCTDSRVTSITLGGMGVRGSEFGGISSFSGLQMLDLSNNRGLIGPLPSTIGNLENLTVLILVGSGFLGPIPESIGSLKKLTFLALNNNSFSGQIPPSIGNLSALRWLDLSDNKLEGSIPVSSGTTLGLDMLHEARHFHLGMNNLSGIIPPQLFSSSMRNLMHVVLDNNQLSGNIPSTVGIVLSLEVVRLDRNLLNGPVPQNLNNLTRLSELHLSNNNLIGLVPNLTGMDLLNFVDMSNNSFDASDVPPWFSSLQSLATLMMENTQLQGQLPVNLFSQPNLQTLVLSHNQLNGTLDVGTGYTNSLTLDLQNNSITDFTQRAGYDMELLLMGNPICEAVGATERFCRISRNRNFSFSPPLNNCMPNNSCSSNMILSPNCKCALPYTGNLHFVFVNFSNGEIDIPNFNASLMEDILSRKLPVGAISYSDPTMDLFNNFQLRLHIFPPGEGRFNRTGISGIGTALNHQRFWNRSHSSSRIFGPSYYIDENYFGSDGSKSSVPPGFIIGAAVGGFVLVLLLVFAGIYAFRQRKRAERAIAQNNPFALWDPDKGYGDIPQINGVRGISFDELKKCTDNFSDAHCIGVGGYGKVYRGTLDSGQLIAIKRAQQGSLQGAFEFKTEIELLSRIHHRNVVILVGFCYERDEQMLIYEYIPNGTIKDSLSGKTGIRLTWTRRLKIALDSARGLAYMHELVNPPIIHRDIKSTNILLDDNLNAKVADFGISVPLGESDANKGYVTTQVKGTLGYLDPEYYSTQQLTEKSDVYSFGIVLLELITARPPILNGKYIVRVVEEAMGKSKDQYKLLSILDPTIVSGTTLAGFDKYVDLAMSCVRESGSERPTMGEVVREIENIIKLASLDLYVESASNSSSYEGATKGYLYHSNGEDTSKTSSSFDTFNTTSSFSPFHTETQSLFDKTEN